VPLQAPVRIRSHPVSKGVRTLESKRDTLRYTEVAPYYTKRRKKGTAIDGLTTNTGSSDGLSHHMGYEEMDQLPDAKDSYSSPSALCSEKGEST